MLIVSSLSGVSEGHLVTCLVVQLAIGRESCSFFILGMGKGAYFVVLYRIRDRGRLYFRVV